jgi:spermidine synthase
VNRPSHHIIYETDTAHEHFEVVEMVYNNRPSRLLLSGRSRSAQSGIALDGDPRLLFDYNQYFFEIVARLNPSSVLLIGGGVYTLPMALLNAFPTIGITVVEPDIALDDIAFRYFNYHVDPRITIVHTDGLSYLRQSDVEFELILIDAFQGDQVPDSLATREAVQSLYRLTTPGGTVAQNVIAPYTGPTAGSTKRRLALYREFFHATSIAPVDPRVPRWSSQNLIIEATRTVVI